MKIACLIGSLTLGGAERQLIGLASALLREGHEVELITYHPDAFYAEEVQRRGIRHTLLKKYTRGQWIWSLARHLKRTRCDLLISFLVSANRKACLAHMLYPGFRLIVSERDFSGRVHLHDRIHFTLYRQAERVVCNNYSQEAFLRSHFPKLSARLETIPNFVDTERFHPADTPLSPAPLVRVVTTARVCRRKNTLGLIEAAALLRDAPVRFDWYGLVRENGYYRRCLRRIAQLGLEDRFQIHNAEHDVAPLYRGADLFCLPSFHEGTSNSLAEALASGLPAAVSAVSDNPRYVHEGVNGTLFHPELSASIAEAVMRIAFLPAEERTAYGLRGRASVCTALSLASFERRWAELVKGKN
ncbi:MAG: glycosyltransferase [Bacteroidales bacterium]|nr:glycosyltransferase [Bacteroidales bacterium]